MTELICSFPGCWRLVRVLKCMLCATHYNQQQAGRALTTIKEPLIGCLFPGCPNPHKARGWCGGHHNQVIVRKIQPTPLKSYAKAKRLCGFEDCGRPHCANGLCVTHDWHRRQGHELKPIRKKLTHELPCSFSGCEKTQKSSGYCGGHLSQHYRGKVMTPLRNYSRTKHAA